MEQNDIQRIEDQFCDAMLNKNLIELNETVVEKAWDLAMQDSPLGDIPIVGSLIKTIKLGAGIRDYFFIKKLLKFLVGISQISPEERERFKEKMKEKGEFEKVSENLLMLIDKIEDLEKAELIARLFVKVLEGEITYGGFRQYSTIVLKSFVDDLRTLRNFKEGETYSGHAKSALLGLGLLNLAPIFMEKKFEDMDDEGNVGSNYRETYVPKNLKKPGFAEWDYKLDLEVYVNEDGQYLYEILFSQTE